MSDHYVVNWQTPGTLKDGNIWVQKNYSQHGGITEIVVTVLKYQNGWKKVSEKEFKHDNLASNFANSLVKKYGLEKEGDMNESKMADLELLGQDWEQGMSENERDSLCHKAGVHSDYWHWDWDEIPIQDRVKLYKASRVKEDAEPIWKDTDIRPDNMESKLSEIQRKALAEIARKK